MIPRLRLKLALAAFLLAAISTSAQDVPAVTLRRTACFGTCPVYSLEVYEDGRVHYKGEQFVGVVGSQEALISAGDVKTLVASFLRVDYLHLDDVYRTHKNLDGTTETITDQPTTYTSLRMGTQIKSVEDYAFSPPKLQKLEEEIDRVANTHRWIHADDDLKKWEIVQSDVYRRIKPGLNLLMQAAGKGDAHALRTEHDHGTSVDAQDETGWTALMLAAEQSHEATVLQLLGWNARIDFKDKHGDDALFGAASASCYDPEMRKAQAHIVKLLIAHGAEPNRKDDAGLTPLMVLATYGNKAAAKVLVDAGARLDLRDNEGKTALDHARAALEKFHDYDWAGELRQLVKFLEETEGRTPTQVSNPN